MNYRFLERETRLWFTIIVTNAIRKSSTFCQKMISK